MKRCSTCKREQPDWEFLKRSDRPGAFRAECRTCGARRSKQRYAANKESHRKALRRYNRENLTAANERKKRWKRRNPQRYKAFVARQAFKEKARQLLGAAVRSGKIKKPEKCEGCPSTDELGGHHNDYRKPLEVVWLCTICHGLRHRAEN